MKAEVGYLESHRQHVEVLGELPDWTQAHALVRDSEGRHSIAFDLAPGIYTCKLRLDRTDWCLVPNLPHDDVHGANNSTLIVGGAEPPLFFAPCRRCWVLGPDGELHVYFEVSTGATEPTLEILTEDGTLCARLVPYWRLRSGSRVLLRCRGRISAGAKYARFQGYPGQWQLPEPESAEIPAWLRHGVIYSVFVDRWLRGDQSPPEPRAVNRGTASTRRTFYGGDLDGIRQSLPYLQALGVTALALTPINTSHSPHRYDVLDFASVDPKLGGERALDELICDCHEMGIALILDLAFTHCHEDHPAFQDLLRKQQASAYADWFLVDRFPVSKNEPDSYRYYSMLPHLPLLNVRCEALLEHLLSTVTGLVARGVDGFRLDAMEMLPESFWRELRRRTRALNPEVGLLGECLTEPILRCLSAADAVTDFRCRELLRSCFGTQQLNASVFSEAFEVIAQRHGPRTEQHRLQFLDNHDTNRFLTEAVFCSRLRLALTFTLLRSDPVWFYYGTEHSLTSRVASLGQDNAWPDRLPMVPLDTQSVTCELVRQLIVLRKQLDQEGYGPALMIEHGPLAVCFERRSSRHRICVLLNVSSESVELPRWMTEAELVILVELELPLGNHLPPQSGLVTRQPLDVLGA